MVPLVPQAMISSGFMVFEEDHRMYVKWSHKSFVIFYADDMLLATNDNKMVVPELWNEGYGWNKFCI